MLETDQKKVWKARAKTYNNLKWVNNDNLKKAILKHGDFAPNQIVLDAGTGTGAIAVTIAPHVKEVHGIDISPEMLSLAFNGCKNVFYKEGDIRSMNIADGYYDRVTARNVFHNILSAEDRLKAAKECLRVLKKGGKFILQEGVPPHPSLKSDFERIFALKETRVTFVPEEMKKLLRDAGFAKASVEIVKDPDFDLINWLDNDGTLSEEVKKRIVYLHVNGSEEFKKHYNVRTAGGRILIDTNAAFAIGEK
ncbi:MAG: methyltransferase domain-containing protein [Candidatus Aenigmarchaeota archaeon]|nr:methyltransferase domain-containing protein [Candidatus Aenigmarchaeota archaeon]